MTKNYKHSRGQIRKVQYMAAASFLTLFSCGSVYAQGAAPTEASTLDEIVVTAQRRTENLQDVPLAISAIAAQEVQEAGITDLSGVATRVPGLTFSPFSPGQNIVALRGVSSNDDGAGTDNSVAVFVDGVYQGRVSNINPEMFDVQSIEVLRGPQGTLYGKNTIGGAIVINSTRPNTSELDARVQLDVGNYNRVALQGLVTGPIADGVAGKFSFLRRQRDGYIRNVVRNTDEQDDDSQAYRGQLLYQGDKVSVLLSADYNKLDVADMGRVPFTQVTGNLGPIVDEYRRLCGTNYTSCAANPVKGYTNREAYGVSAQVDVDVGIGQITSITAYRDSSVNWLMDSVGVPSFPLGDLIDDSTKQWSQELRLSGDKGSLKYVFGAFYLNEKTDRTEIFDFGVQGDLARSSQYTQDNVLDSYAAFGQLDWQFATNWVLTLGGRYTYEKKSIDNNAFAGDFPVIGTTFVNSRSANWSGFTPRAVLSYHPAPNTTAYVSYAQGFKSGGFAAAPTTVRDTDPLKQENANNYELGYKTELLDRTLRVNAALFFTEYSDLQYQNFGPRPGVPEFGIFRTVNLASAEAKGLEVEVDWIPITNLTISGSYGYLDAQYTNARVPTSNYPVQDGQDMIRAPRNKYSVNVRYEAPLNGHGVLAGLVSYRFTDDQRGELEPYAIQKKFAVLDGRVAWTSESGKAEVALWGKNLADEDYISHLYTIGGEVFGVAGEPRMYGLSLTLRN